MGDISPMPIRPLPLTLATCSLLLCALPARAQDRPVATPQPQWELRADWTTAQRDAAHLGVGLNIRAGWYARVGGLLALGAAEGPLEEWRASQRADLTVRFLLDPYAERPRGFYAGAGVTVRRDGDAPLDARLLVLLGVEGRPDGKWVPSLELGLGGGLRLGVVLRPRRSGPAR